MDFHFIDYVVHGWDVAATLGIPFELPADVLTAALPLALFVPDGDFRAIEGHRSGPLSMRGTDDLDRILRHLGRRRIGPPPAHRSGSGHPGEGQPYSTVTGAWSDHRSA